MKARTLLLLIVSLVTLALGRPAIHHTRPDPDWPPLAVTTGDTAQAGHQITFTISFAGSNAHDESVDLSASPSVFVDLPSSVTVLAGHTSVDVTATIDSGASGSFTLTATNGLGYATSKACPIQTRL